MTLTIDTHVLRAIDDPANPICFNVLRLVILISDGEHTIAVDTGDNIEAEYRRNFRESGHAFKWLQTMYDAFNVHWLDGSVPKQHKKRLEQLEFDDDDLVFVGVASRTDSRLLVAEESDYTCEVCDYLEQSRLAVSVKDVVDAAGVMPPAGG